MKMPSLEESVNRLMAVSGVEEFDPDTPLTSSAVDSLDLTEWVYHMQEQYPELALDESIVGEINDSMTFRDLHKKIQEDRVVGAVANDG
ncbi:hypothetical protein [Naumannella cuiyingiana]|uniref:Carrier domain-containing protein n=1 Tax=Naumannella cuiyingiana TaxID=1347891 RepID=A0A7Z0DAC1_9ACTN|nr:hypothetical protein [Naumannella cuiyingiana]NYI71623.1 hypothetical protein [Naumannella cuiyingiana]